MMVVLVAGLAWASDYAPELLPVSPAPRQVQLTAGEWRPPDGPLRWQADPDTPADFRAVARSKAQGWSPGGRRAPVRIHVPDSTVAPQGYRLVVRAEGVDVTAADADGLRYALDTLTQLHAAGPVPVGVVDDAPALAARWVHVQLPGRTTGGDPLFPRQKARLGALSTFSGTADYLPLLEALGDDAVAARLNGIVLELGGMWRFPSHPELALPGAAPLEALTPWIADLEARGVDVLPLLPLFSHQEQLLAPVYPQLLLTPMRTLPKKRGKPPDDVFWWNPLYDPRKEQVQIVVSDLLDDIFDVFSPRLVHVGHDEAGALRFVGGVDPVALFVDSVDRLRTEVQQRGAQIAIWADMLLDGHRVPGAAHGSEAGVQTWKGLDALDDDVMLFDWQYHGSPASWPRTGDLDDVPSLRYLAASGKPVMGTALGRPVVHPSQAVRFGRQVEQSARIARVLAELSDAGEGQIQGHLTAQFAWTPGRMAPWTGTDVAGAVWVAGWHGWTGGAVIWPPAPDLPGG